MTLRSLEEQEAIFTRSVELFAHELELTKEKLSVGLVGNIDVAQTQAELDQTIQQQVEIRRQRADTEYALAILTGRPPEKFSLGPKTADLQLPVIPTGLPAGLLRHRPDVAEAEQNLIAANANIGVAISNYYPAVSLTGSAGYANLNVQTLTNWQSVLLTFAPTVSIPIFEGGKLEAQEAQARARFDELLADYRSALLTALNDVETSLTDVRHYNEELEAQTASVEASREYQRFALIEFQQGIISTLQLIDADRTLLSAEQTEAQLRNNRLVSTVLLVKALGGGWYPEDPTSRPAPTVLAPAETNPAGANPADTSPAGTNPQRAIP
jgi:multidrug efflux system outer membrane protein